MSNSLALVDKMLLLFDEFVSLWLLLFLSLALTDGVDAAAFDELMSA